MGAQVNISSVLEDCARSQNHWKTPENLRFRGASSPLGRKRRPGAATALHCPVLMRVQTRVRARS